jgi:hypothetical protein
MNELFLTPYTLVENKDYPIDTKIIIRASDFSNVPFQDGRITRSPKSPDFGFFFNNITRWHPFLNPMARIFNPCP